MTSLCIINLTGGPAVHCYVELANCVCFATLGYLTLLLNIYLRCAKSPIPYGRLLRGHGPRAVLSLLLLLVHLAELGELLAAGHFWLQPVLANLAFVSVQAFYVTIENFGRGGYLAATGMLYLACGLARGVLLYRLLELRDFRHLTTCTAALSSSIYYAHAFNDIIALIHEIKLEEEEKAFVGAFESYRHHKATWCSRVTFFWLIPLLKMGFKNPLELDDLGKLPAKESSAHQYETFIRVFNKTKGCKEVPSLWKCYFLCHWKNFLLGGILKLAGDLVGLVAPLGIAVVVDYAAQSQLAEQSQGYSVTVKDFLSNGYIMTAIIFISAVAQGSFSQASTHLVTVEGIRLKTALQGIIYGKALKLSLSNQDDESTNTDSKVGNITNLMAEDTFNIMTGLWIGHYIWAIPVKISLLMYLLYCKLGISAVIGASCCIVLMTPLQFFIGKKISINSKIISNLCDERLRMTNEMLQGIKALKLCAWETHFCSRLMVSRNKELKFLDRDSLYWALMMITLVTLVACYYLEGGQLSAANVFSALALFNQLTVPLFIFPITVPIVISAMVSTRRLEEFLGQQETSSYFPVDSTSLVTVKKTPQKKWQDKGRMFGLGGIVEELEEEELDEDGSGESKQSSLRGSNVCILREASFSWTDNGKPSLWISSLNIPKGQLTAVIGKVGCGKTTFLNALLGEIKCTSGLLKWEKDVSFAYVSQQPWLLNATLRENILMGLSYKPRRFDRVIAATALQPDIDILPNKDLTELGEKGINLSGGQRQRVALARALYSKATTIILDDPLSAVDYHVAQHVFENGIMSLVTKQKKTVIMVTHSWHLLTYAHKVIALENGKMRACGKLRDMQLIDGVVTGMEQPDLRFDSRGRTARERWQLVKLVSKLGHHIRQQNIKYQGKQLFIPFRKRLSAGSEYYWAQELPLPSPLQSGRGEMESLQRSSTLPRHRPVARASSLQPHSLAPTHINSVTRQASTPSINQGSRHRTYTFDGMTSHGENLLKQIFITTSKHVTSGSEPPAHTTSFKEKNLLKRLMSSSSIKSVVFNDNDRHPIQRIPSVCSDCSDDLYDEEENLNADWCGTSSLDEREYGTISPYVYLSYIRACGLVAAAFYIMLAISWQSFKVYTDFWLSKWTQNSPVHKVNETFYYLIVYCGFSFGCVLIALMANLIGQYCGAKARRRLHKYLLYSVLALPMRIFETTPLCRILARFSTDITVIDKKLTTSVQRLLQFLLLCFSAILVNAIVTPWFLILAVPICIVYYAVQKFYRCSSRELQRLDSMTRTPILSHLCETISGLETIRAYKQQRRFIAALFFKLDNHTNAFLIANSAARWLGIALDYLGAAIVLVAMLVSLICSQLMPDLVTPALVGLAINYTLLVPIYLNWVVKFTSDVEMYMAGVERVCHYIKMQPEDYKVNGFVPRCWPAKGEIKFIGVSLRYDQRHEVAVSNLNLFIPPGQKIGICGRTGSGKSSLVMSLFGMSPVIEGSILIDGIDISSLPLQVLRSRLSIIPQDIIMFSGTIRENLDMENRYSDAKLWEALEMAQMKEIISSQLGGLDGPVKEGGVNLSAGQRQLLCLARAVLHDAACLVMDEATSALDLTTEKTFTHAAEKAFANKTVITIAHRLTTLLSCDRIIVLELGKIVEDGSPSELLSRSMGIFSSMLRSSMGSVQHP
ncbi:sulfonylurea receptor isoform X2 [Rhodnius prolixus]|uniref:sulfonylurea receptor isoform X2 n=1 Tax=Rhodnius prolixus TaxID=13249 RepID=UPI003D189693